MHKGILKKTRNQKGLTLIEMMVSMVILSTVLLSSVFVLVQARQTSEEARTRLLATNAAKSVLDVIKNTALTSVSAINTTSYIPAGLTNGAITITTNPANVTGLTVATVTVRVSWTGPKNATKQIDFTTMRSSY